MRRSILACGLLLAVAAISSAASGAAGAIGTTRHATRSAARAGGRTARYWTGQTRVARAATQRWLTVMEGRPPHVSRARTLAAHSPDQARHLALHWRWRAHTAWLHAHHPPMLRDWYCIHHIEGSWTDHGAPYWGGLQMDYTFQRSYGGWLLRHKGTADRWTPLEQIWTAVRAWRVRGFEPWAASAHRCGAT